MSVTRGSKVTAADLNELATLANGKTQLGPARPFAFMDTGIKGEMERLRRAILDALPSGNPTAEEWPMSGPKLAVSGPWLIPGDGGPLAGSTGKWFFNEDFTRGVRSYTTFHDRAGFVFRDYGDAASLTTNIVLDLYDPFPREDLYGDRREHIIFPFSLKALTAGGDPVRGRLTGFLRGYYEGPTSPPASALHFVASGLGYTKTVVELPYNESRIDIAIDCDYTADGSPLRLDFFADAPYKWTQFEGVNILQQLSFEVTTSSKTSVPGIDSQYPVSCIWAEAFKEIMFGYDPELDVKFEGSHGETYFYPGNQGAIVYTPSANIAGRGLFVAKTFPVIGGGYILDLTSQGLDITSTQGVIYPDSALAAPLNPPAGQQHFDAVQPAVLEFHLPRWYCRRDTESKATLQAQGWEFTGSPNIVQAIQGGLAIMSICLSRPPVKQGRFDLFPTTKPELNVVFGCIRNGTFVELGTGTIPENADVGCVQGNDLGELQFWPIFTIDELVFQCSERVDVQALAMLAPAIGDVLGIYSSSAHQVAYPILAAHYNDTEALLHLLG